MSGVCEREAPGILSLEESRVTRGGLFCLWMYVPGQRFLFFFFFLQASVRVRECVCARGMPECVSECMCNSVVDQQRALRIMQPTVLITL